MLTRRSLFLFYNFPNFYLNFEGHRRWKRQKMKKGERPHVPFSSIVSFWARQTKLMECEKLWIRCKTDNLTVVDFNIFIYFYFLVSLMIRSNGIFWENVRGCEGEIWHRMIVGGFCLKEDQFISWLCSTKFSPFNKPIMLETTNSFNPIDPLPWLLISLSSSYFLAFSLL